ncbi:hypothetical protein [Leekyejoonella antrihumi]|uniref:Uncharacterized protein n=1 Tax=Leekyejoonella antrihumi TaxID=1660198 RepID=A0A563E7V3_9MICO|nr:hypothetical protein [Leekyejoonella antrihumi]TWP38323.1 hypothetical protein FGL98_03690 [Leekyejoonella antrihumi]
MRRESGRTALLARLIGLADELRKRPEVRQATVFRAVLIPPVGGRLTRPARFDVAVLVQTVSSDTLASVRSDPAFTALDGALRGASSNVHVMAARCARLLAPVDHTRDGLFLFNYFASADGRLDTEAAINVWEHLAAWYIAQTGLTNSALLAPTGPCDYVLVNHARWDTGLPTLAARQFSKRTFHTYVRANLRDNHLIAMPALYRLA